MDEIGESKFINELYRKRKHSKNLFKRVEHLIGSISLFVATDSFPYVIVKLAK